MLLVLFCQDWGNFMKFDLNKYIHNKQLSEEKSSSAKYIFLENIFTSPTSLGLGKESK